ncbi:hypothetical protein D2E76_16460 [Mycobacteroides abscessus]|uniref:Uncharacterized protein n=1 Tax=Mycobacteroides abscessus TaxID=36809 RepID=A0ABD7HMX8_9MYCO|nr:hypothetical protein [Mycobacteroides abscessus]RIT36843.1 hypothetical protein D2E76_16460 [Mycobacteroides abscessus]
MKVTHPERSDTGRIVESDAKAWTPNELTAGAPDDGMVKVRWSDSADPAALFWEYEFELAEVQ